MAKKKPAEQAAAKRKQCPHCKMEVDADAVNCPGCNALFDDSPQGATAAAAPPPDPDAEPEPDAEAEAEAEADAES